MDFKAMEMVFVLLGSVPIAGARAWITSGLEWSGYRVSACLEVGGSPKLGLTY